MKTMYEINWHYKDREQTQFSHCTVTPITIIREGILPGCTAVSITAKDTNGRTFQGSPRDYFETEAAAWAQARRDLIETIENNDNKVEELIAESQRIFSFLLTLRDSGEAP